jgi:SH3-like domain-containing protein
MSNGGLYESEDDLQTWRRIDSDGERGKVTEILAQGMATFLVASEQEGMLRLLPD